MSTICLQCEKRNSSSLKLGGSLKSKINISNNAITKFSSSLLLNFKSGVLLSSKAKLQTSSTTKSSYVLSANAKVNNIIDLNIRFKPIFTSNLKAKNKSFLNLSEVFADKFAGNIDKIKSLSDYACTQKLYPISDIVTSLNNSHFVDKNLNFNNLYSSIDEGVHVGNYVQAGKNSALISDEKNSYIQPSSVFTKGDFRYKFGVTKPNTIDESFLFIRASAPMSNYDSNIPPQYRLHNIKLEDPSGNLIIKYNDIIIRGDADYNTDYVNFVTYISDPQVNNLSLNIWDNKYPLMNESSGYCLNIDFSIDCLDDPFSEGFNKGYEDTCKLDFINSSNNDYLSIDGSPLSTQTQNFSLNPTNSLRISSIEICNSGGVGILNGDYLKFYTEVNPTGQRLQRRILPVEIMPRDVSLNVYPDVKSLWESSSDDFGNFAINTSASGNNVLLSKLQDNSVFNYIKLVNNDPELDSGRLTLKFSHKSPNFVDALINGSFSTSYSDQFNRAILQSIRGQDNFFNIDEVSLIIVAKKDQFSRDYALDIVGYSDDRLLNVTPKVGAFLQNDIDFYIGNPLLIEESQIGSMPKTSGFKGTNDLGISTESISDKSQYYNSNLTNNPAGDHYKLSTYPIVSGTTFSEYIIPLKIYEDEVSLGKSTKYNNSSQFENLYLDIYNLPSGAIFSTIQLLVKYKPSDGIMLNTLGGESQREYATRNQTLYPASDFINSNNRPLSVVENIPQAFTNDETAKFNYSRRWRANNHDILDGAFNPNEFDLFSFYNPALDSPFLGGYFKFNNDSLPYILSENIGQNIPHTGLMVGDYNKTHNIGLRFKQESIDWASSIIDHELSGQIIDSYENSLTLSPTNYINFNNIDFSGGFGIYIRFTPSVDVSGSTYNLFNSGVLFSKWDDGKNLEFALGYKNGYLCGYAETLDGDIVEIKDSVPYYEYQYPLSVLLTYNDNLSSRLRLYTDNELSETFECLRNTSEEFTCYSNNSDLTIAKSFGSGVGFNMLIHELGISYYNDKGNNLVYDNNDRLYRQTPAEKWFESHRSSFINSERSKFWEYIKDEVELWKIGDFKVCSFSADFSRLTKRYGDKFISHSLNHHGSGYEDTITEILPSSINLKNVSYHTQIENDFLRFNLSNIPESENFYSTYPLISKNLPRNYNFSKDSIVVETIIEHSTTNDLIWNNYKVGPKLIVSLYTTNKNDINRPSENNLGLISRTSHYLEPSGCFTKLKSYLQYKDLFETEEWSVFKDEIILKNFDHQYFSKDINDMFLQYDVVYPQSQPFNSTIKIHSANIKLADCVRKADINNSSINLSNSGELKSLSNIPLYVTSLGVVPNETLLYSNGVNPPAMSDGINLFSFGVIDVLSSYLSLYCSNINIDDLTLPLYVSAKTDKFAENNINLFTENLSQDQSADNILYLVLNHKTLEINTNNIDLFIRAMPVLENKRPSSNVSLFIDSFNDVTFTGFNTIPLYIGGSGVLINNVTSNFTLFTVNYPASDVSLNYQETISWNSSNPGKNIVVSDNKEAFLDANDEIRGVELICAGSCILNSGCKE